jgi:hypothetical protein
VCRHACRQAGLPSQQQSNGPFFWDDYRKESEMCSPNIDHIMMVTCVRASQNQNEKPKQVFKIRRRRRWPQNQVTREPQAFDKLIDLQKFVWNLQPEVFVIKQLSYNVSLLAIDIDLN